MEFYLAMQNEAIDHEKFLKGGMCNIYMYKYTACHIYTYIQIDIYFSKYNLHGRDQKKKRIPPYYLMIRLNTEQSYCK